jgi:hypothetical protein
VAVPILPWVKYGTIGHTAALSTLLILVLAARILPAHLLGRSATRAISSERWAGG